jgi:hypothetical protein
MPIQCNAEQLEFAGVRRRRVVAAFHSGRVTLDAGALLVKRTDEAIRLLERHHARPARAVAPIWRLSCPGSQPYVLQANVRD